MGGLARALPEPGTIAVFGSASATPGSPAYIEAYALGRLLAQSGYTVMTGGYSGAMAAASQGASEAGGHVIGVTSVQIERYRPLGPNQWVAEEFRHETLRGRTTQLVALNDGMVALHGGIGTLAEVALAWSWMQVGEISPRPLVLIGQTWRKTIETYAERDKIAMRDMELVYIAASAETAVAYLNVAAAHR